MQSSAIANNVAIGIAGCSCSGKSTIVREMITFDEHTLAIHQDDYYQPVAPKTEDGLENWDVLEALDIGKLIQDVEATVKDPMKHCSICQTTTTTSGQEHRRHAVYIEGTMILDIGMLSELLQVKIFITLSYDECLKRRQQRWKDYIDPPGFFDTCVWPMYMKRERMSLKDPSVKVIDGHQAKEQILDTVRTFVMYKFSS